MATIDAAKFYN